MTNDPSKSLIHNTNPTFMCPYCKGTTYAHILSKDGYEIVRCHQCQLQSLASMPTQEQAIANYQDPTYYAGDEKGYHNYMNMDKVLLPLADRRLKWIMSYLSPEPLCSRLLDIGCAAGFFLQQAQTYTWKLIGIEVAQGMAKKTQQRLGIPVYAGLEELSSEWETLDVITLWEVIEHLADPQKTLRQIYQKLAPNGLLALSTPNTAHWQAQKFPEQWTAYSPPAHLTFFTPTTLRAMVETSGFEILELRGTAPRPQLPLWLETRFEPVRQKLSRGNAKQWRLSLFAWRAVRLLAMLRDRLTRSPDSIMMTLELIARKPGQSNDFTSNCYC